MKKLGLSHQLFFLTLGFVLAMTALVGLYHRALTRASSDLAWLNTQTMGRLSESNELLRDLNKGQENLLKLLREKDLDAIEALEKADKETTKALSEEIAGLKDEGLSKEFSTWREKATVAINQALMGNNADAQYKYFA